MSTDGSYAYFDALVNGRTVKLPLASGSVFRIGRGRRNTLNLGEDKMVSRDHAIVQGAGPGEFYLSDLGSRNGTALNGRLITAPVLLCHGDKIRIGECELTFWQSALPASSTASSSDHSATNLMVDHRLITALVVDIRDYTGLTSRIDQQVLAEVIRAFNKESGAALAKPGSWAQKYIGDAVLALWLHQLPIANGSELLAVFEALRLLEEIVASLQPQFQLDEPVRIGAGVNTGFAVVGNVGSLAASDFTALGEAVNQAFRLESATRQTGCLRLVGDTTYQFLAFTPGCGELFQPHSVKLKGYEKEQKAFSLDESSLANLIARLREHCDDTPSTIPAGA